MSECETIELQFTPDGYWQLGKQIHGKDYVPVRLTDTGEVVGHLSLVGAVNVPGEEYVPGPVLELPNHRDMEVQYLADGATGSLAWFTVDKRTEDWSPILLEDEEHTSIMTRCQPEDTSEQPPAPPVVPPAPPEQPPAPPVVPPTITTTTSTTTTVSVPVDTPELPHTGTESDILAIAGLWLGAFGMLALAASKKFARRG